MTNGNVITIDDAITNGDAIDVAIVVGTKL